VSAYLPPRERTSAEVEQRIRDASPGFTLPPGIIETMTGVRTRRVADDAVATSDLAAAAGRDAILQAGIDAAEVDLLIFASASQDLIEPATANIVQEKVGTACPVFDLKNACNSFLNGLQVAEAMVQNGSHRTVLVTAGEMPSRAVRWRVSDRAEFKESFLGYTLGDAGAAAVVTASDDERGIFYRAFQTVSRYWDIATLPGGGSMHGHGEEFAYFRGDGQRLRRAFRDVGPGILFDALARTETCFADYDRILVHQASMPALDAFMAATGVPREKVVLTLPDYGNMAAASLPVAFALAHDAGEIRDGDLTMWLGLAAGISLGVVLMRV
jgi:3-oxoacyl-[acyl-carrier-protein] synthase-3